jgi:DNA-binding MarR family transcriptional regulator
MTSHGKPIHELSDSEAVAAGKAADAVRNFRLILFCGQRLRTLLDGHLREAGLTTQQGVMLSIVRTKALPSLGEVAAAMATSHQNAKQIAVVLERKGMLEIIADENDRRTRRLKPTAAGRRGWRARDANDFNAIGTWFAGLSRAEQTELRSLLERLAGSIDR